MDCGSTDSTESTILAGRFTAQHVAACCGVLAVTCGAQQHQCMCSAEAVAAMVCIGGSALASESRAAVKWTYLWMCAGHVMMLV